VSYLSSRNCLCIYRVGVRAYVSLRKYFRTLTLALRFRDCFCTVTLRFVRSCVALRCLYARRLYAYTVCMKYRLYIHTACRQIHIYSYQHTDRYNALHLHTYVSIVTKFRYSVIIFANAFATVCLCLWSSHFWTVRRNGFRSGEAMRLSKYKFIKWN